jgi:hypothetical protein
MVIRVLHHSRRIAVSAAIVLTVLCNAGSAGSAQISSRAVRKDLVTLAIAQSVYSRIWPGIIEGVKTNSNAVPSLVTTGVLKVITAELVCGCGEFLGHPASHELAAPDETAYPLSFLAEVDVPANSLLPNGRLTPLASVTFVVFQKTSTRTPWLVAYLAGYGGSARTLANTNTSTMRGVTPPGFPTRGPFVQFVQALQSAREIGTIPAGNFWANSKAPNTEPADTLRALESAHDSDTNLGWTFKGSYRIESNSRTFATPAGILQCAEISGSGSYLQGTYVQPPDQSAFPVTLAPGTYSSVTITSERDMCLLERSSGQIRMAGLLGGTFSAFGVLKSA